MTVNESDFPKLRESGFELKSQADDAYNCLAWAIAIYGMHGEYLHVARQLRDGRWTSKLGPDEDICHSLPDALVGEAYGQIVKFMKRPYPQEPVLGDV